LTSFSTLRFLPLTQVLVQACEKFNERLRQAGHEGNFDCSANRDRGENPPAPMEVERYVAVDANGEVRGAYLLRWQYLWLRGEQFLGASGGCPVSEGIIDKHYAMVGVSILRDIVKRCEFIYFLGAGGRNGNIFRVARHAHWKIADVPFFFRIVNGSQFVRKLPQLKSNSGRRLLASVANVSGLAPIATGLIHAAAAVSHFGSTSLRSSAGFTVEEVSSLTGIADEIWPRVNSQYAFCVVRDGAHVGGSFPSDRTDLHRLVVRRQGKIVGWTVVMKEGLSRLRTYLGDVRPGLILDVFGDTTHATDLVRAATAYLAAQDLDVIITNTCHSHWVNAFKRSGFLAWHSQFPLIVSQELARRIGDLPLIMRQAHMSRGDGDGVHYLH
jgi:hypothetical protein